jgi:hypothetical protein
VLPFLGWSQVQIGQDILGEFISDQFGIDVSISDNGNIIAVSAPSADLNGEASGSVKVFANNNGDWIQIGQTLIGESEVDFFGTSVDLSSDGNILAVGAYLNEGRGHVRVFENQSDVWIQVGEDIDGEISGEDSGWTISISDDGNIIAIGSKGGYVDGINTGLVRVFENQSGVWIQIGENINGEDSQDRFGSNVNLSSDGNIVAIGAPYNDGNGQDSGHVRVFENQSGIWTQIGQDIDGEDNFDKSGWSVSLSSDGNIIAIGARSNSPGTPLYISGHVRVFENQSGIWTQIGQDIDGDAEADRFGTAISLSSNGNLLTIGAHKNDTNGIDSGQIKIFYFNNLDWIQVGQDILGEVPQFGLGFSIDMTSDGNSIITGGPSYNGNGYNAGLARVYSIASELATIEVIDDILGNTNGINVTAAQLNSISGVSGAIEGVNYTTALNNGTFVDENNPTAAEIQLIIDQVNATLSLNENKLFSLSIYPNPAKTQFTIQLDPSVQLEKVSIYNTLGQVVLTSEEHIVNTSTLSSGSYIVEITTNKGKSSKKLIIE